LKWKSIWNSFLWLTLVFNNANDKIFFDLVCYYLRRSVTNMKSKIHRCVLNLLTKILRQRTNPPFPHFRSYPVIDSLSICFYYNNYLTFSSVIILYYYLYNGTRVGTCRYLRVLRTPIIITYRTSPGHDNRPAIIIMSTEIISLISPTSFIFLRWSCVSSTYLTQSVDIPNCYVEKKTKKIHLIWMRKKVTLIL
jgi:hypothetical protein